MSRLHMQTDQVLAAARQLERTAQEIENEMEWLKQRIYSIPWEGPGRDDYVQQVGQLVKQFQQRAQEGMVLSQRVNREVDEWLEVDSKFGGQLHTTVSVPVKAAVEKFRLPPGNVRELAAYTMDGNGQPIKIIKVGDNEYLVVLRGTEGGQGGHNWGSAITTGLGLPGDYQRQVEKVIHENIPPGATINFSGHSQGGIVANNLSDDQDLLNNYKMGQVYTFGSPSSAGSGDNFHRFAADGDPVPFLDRHVIQPSITNAVLGSMLGGPLLSALFGNGSLASIATASVSSQTHIAGTGDAISSHGVYSTSTELEQYKVTYNQWDTNWNTAHDGQYQFGTVAESSLSLIEADLTSGNPLRIGDGLRQAPGELTRTLVTGITYNMITPITDSLPKGLRNAVDGFLDRANEFVLTSGAR